MRKDCGSLNLEMALLISLLALAVIFGLTWLGDNINNTYNDASTVIMASKTNGSTGTVNFEDFETIPDIWEDPDTEISDTVIIDDPTGNSMGKVLRVDVDDAFKRDILIAMNINFEGGKQYLWEFDIYAPAVNVNNTIIGALLRPTIKSSVYPDLTSFLYWGDYFSSEDYFENISPPDTWIHINSQTHPMAWPGYFELINNYSPMPSEPIMLDWFPVGQDGDYYYIDNIRFTEIL